MVMQSGNGSTVDRGSLSGYTKALAPKGRECYTSSLLELCGCHNDLSPTWTTHAGLKVKPGNTNEDYASVSIWPHYHTFPKNLLQYGMNSPR